MVNLMKSIYLDHAASTPLHPLVVEEMLLVLNSSYGNPSSTHAFGRTARSLIGKARDQIAAYLNCSSRELIFTGGGTESNNTVIYGAGLQPSEHPIHLVTTQIEHHAVLHACRKMEQHGVQVTYVAPDSAGRVHSQDIERAINKNTRLISVMYGNNETGTLQPIEEIGMMARKHRIRFHVDGVQALGIENLDLASLPVDFMSFSAHKLNGPKGVGILYWSEQASVEPLLEGGAQERNRRAGTENVAGIAGLAKALQIAQESQAEKRKRLEDLRHTMLQVFDEELDTGSYVVNGDPVRHLPHILNVSFPGVDRETVLMRLDLEGIAASSGSACTSGSLQASHVLAAMGLPQEIIHSAIRFSFGSEQTREQIEQASKNIIRVVKEIRMR